MSLYIINIPEEVYKNIQSKSTKIQAEGYTVENAVLNGIPIPDNATNGDVIKAMFPNGTTAKFATFMRFIDGEHYFNCSDDWWDAPHQKGE